MSLAAGAIRHRHGLYFLLDAAQTAGVFPIDMEKDRIDIVCFTGHKSLFGPQGTGGLCVREGLSVVPLITGGTGSQTFSQEAPSCRNTPLRPERSMRMGLPVSRLAYSILNSWAFT